MGRFLISHGRDVIFEPEHGAPLVECAIYLQGTVLGVLLNQRGKIVLHASAVEMGGKAVLFCGPSGEGKSTMAAALSMRGHRVIGDDVCAIGFDEKQRPVVSADARRLKLDDVCIDAMQLEAQRDEPAPGSKGKVYVNPPHGWNGHELLLGAIYMLQSGPEEIDHITQLPSATALRKLRDNAHRPTLVRRTGQTARYFEAAAQILRHANVFTISRHRDLSRLAGTAAMLEEHWRSIGLSNGQTNN